MEFFQKKWELMQLKIKYMKFKKWKEKIKQKDLKYETKKYT